MSVLRKAPVEQPVNELIAGRWSPRALSPRRIDRATLATLFEAARWAPSCFNEQPWRYLFATQDDPAAFETLASLLVPGNAWAKNGYLLALSVAHLVFARNNRPNPHAWHDVGAASENMFLQASELGLYMHEMAGFDRERATALLAPDAQLEPVAMIAIGYPGDPASLAEPQRAGETAPRTRMPVSAFAFEGAWGKPAVFTR